MVIAFLLSPALPALIPGLGTVHCKAPIMREASQSLFSLILPFVPGPGGRQSPGLQCRHQVLVSNSPRVAARKTHASEQPHNRVSQTSRPALCALPFLRASASAEAALPAGTPVGEESGERGKERRWQREDTAS